MIVKELKKLILQSELVSIERDCNDEDLRGIVAFVTVNLCGMHLFTDQGEYDGFTLFETTQIEEVYWGNREHKAIKACIPKDLIKYETPNITSNHFIDAILDLSQFSKSLCFYQYGDEDMFCIGEILDKDEEWLKLNAWGVKKSLSRKQILLKIGNISRVVANSPYQLQIVNLHSIDF